MNPIVKIVVSMIIWGSIGVFVKWVDLPSVELVFLRAAIASIFLLVTKFIMGKKRDKLGEKASYSTKDLALLILSGVLMAINWLLLFQAYKYTTVANSTLVYYMAPIIVIFLSPLVLKEKVTVRSIAGVIVAMVGLVLIVMNKPQEVGGDYTHSTGILYAFLAAVLYATIVLLNKKTKGFLSYDRTFIQICISAIVLLPIILFRGLLHISSLKVLIVVFILGIVHTGIAYLLYFSSFEKVDSQRLSILSYIDPISAVAFGVVFLNESINVSLIIGGMLILISTIFSTKTKEDKVTTS